ncbi:MAG TPA: tetratricopeptide repeat protein, partial [Anaerolineae bacterium]|nr:tetratricopeptide repeat protein [Anaerolineae bacterium]
NNLLVLLNLGVIYFDLDQFDKAERAFCAAVQRLPHRGGWYALEAQIKTNLGAVYQATERHEAAIVVLVEAVQKWREVGNLLCLCRALLNLAESQIVLMHYAVAFDTCLEAGIWLEFYPEQHQAGEMLLECQQIGEMLAEAQGIGRN